MKKIFITGLGGSGKDHLKRKFLDKGFTSSIFHTTRPIRKNETDGIDYYYISNDEFIEKINNNFFIEYTQYENGWFYGISHDEFEKKDIFIISPQSFLKWDEKIKKNVFKILLNIGIDVRRERLEKRGDSDIAERRLISDQKDFELLNNKYFDLIITNEDF